jgi:hypothetical protein
MEKMAPGVERTDARGVCVRNGGSQSNPNDDAKDLTIDHSPYQAHSLSFS